MKKSFKYFLALLICVLLVLVSCDNPDSTANNPTSDTTASSDTQSSEIPEQDIIAADFPQMRFQAYNCLTDKYVYFSEPLSESQSEYKRIVRFNYETGTVTCPCNDALCAHNDESCVMVINASYLNPILVFGDVLYYSAIVRDRSSTQTVLRRVVYNMKTGESDEIFKDAGDKDAGSSECVVNMGEYLYHASYRAEKNKQTGKYEYLSVIQRYNINTGEEKEIYSQNDLINIKIAGKNRIYFGISYQDVYESATFSIDKDGKDLREEPSFICDSPWYAYKNKMFYHGKNNSIWVNDVVTGERSCIVEDHITGSFGMTDKYIYYCMKAPELIAALDELIKNPIPGIEGIEARNQAKKAVNASVTYIWRCNHDGENKQLIAELPGASIALNVYGNYIYSPYDFYDPQTGEALQLSNPLRTHCRINMDTWEVEKLPHSEE